LRDKAFAVQILAAKVSQGERVSPSSDTFKRKMLYGILRLRLSRNGGQSPPAPISRALLRFASHRQSILSG
jgi:hypothetical protein